jgi:transcriptional regulator with XRE-family HTH domain
VTIDPEYITNKDIVIPEEVTDVGDLLRTLRNNHGYKILKLAKMIGVPPTKISQIEIGRAELPNEVILRRWLSALGCGRNNTNKIILITRQYQVKHWLTLVRKEPCNPDLIRLLAAYRHKALTAYDRALLRLIARTPIRKDISSED